eukprot:CAMPEP_0119310898 /NCGR_PEP_ID=MMETSP1333-20130426/20736_1 /TAXON_ID=418940 /ORGANISM="Scyphosphaera apsteinii, Strain RCC1455" /LENGTH=450 /DNA_ID=CAMNT_0007315161 /DNA_START=272 /DNA_END=1624 /DNA_ORIENTATION=+
MNGGKGFGGGEATRDPAPTVYDPADPKGKQQAIHKAESFADYLARRSDVAAISTSPAGGISTPPAGGIGFSMKHDGPSSGVDINNELLSWRPDDPLARKGKVVGTLGPATMTLEMIEKLIKAGLDIFRLNSSHRQSGDFERIVPIIREAAKRLGRDVYILGDLQGPKFRCGTVKGDSIELVVGETVEMALMAHESDLTVSGRITLADTTEQNAMLRGLEVGMDVLLNDGFLAMKVVERVSPNTVKCEITIGGPLKSRKGINVPDLQIDCAALTAKDRDDAEYLLDKVDYIAVSFVQKGADIQELIDIMDAQGMPAEDRPLIIPKIEKPAALKNIDEILAVSDGLMVARGDMGVELGLERVPFAQKFLIKKANEAKKFCITATQMMESMIEAPVPTRAEVSDVANAIFDGSDAVMLSGECAVGKFPCETVEAMGRTISAAEHHVKVLSPGF